MADDKKRILVVVAATEALAYLMGDLVNAGYEVRGASTANQVASAIRNNKFDLIVAEDELAERESLWLLKSLRSFQSCETLPVIILASNEQAVAAAWKAEANAVLEKPVTSEDILVFIERIFAVQDPDPATTEFGKT